MGDYLWFQALQALRGHPLLPGAHAGALVLLGRVISGGLLRPRAPEVQPDPQRHLAGQQRCAHMGQQALRQKHQPQGKLRGGFERHRWEKKPLNFTAQRHANHHRLGRGSFCLSCSSMELAWYNQPFSSPVFPVFLHRRRLSQLPPHVPLWLRHQWVRLQAQPHHCLHRPHVLPGSGLGLQEGVEGHHRGPRAADGRRQLQKWLKDTNRVKKIKWRKKRLLNVAAGEGGGWGWGLDVMLLIIRWASSRS